ncbi:MAG: hypothetical protein AAF533_20365 [Acidobacteriota bacterium]
MKKTYRGASPSDLLRRAVEDLGESAVVVSTRQLSSSPPQHELVVSCDAGETALTPVPTRDRNQLLGRLVGSGARGVLAELVRKTRRGREPAPESSPARGGSSLGRRASDPLVRPLVQSGVDEALVPELIQEATARGGEIQEALREVMARRLAGSGERQDPERIIMLAGPSGVGKTTLAAKLAAQHLFRRGHQPVLISVDRFRVGAQDQLRTFAELIGVPFAAVDDDEALSQQLKLHRRHHPILIDTPGLLLHRSEDRGQLSRWLDLAGKASLLLVLSGASSVEAVRSSVEGARPLGIWGLAFTKLDERPAHGLMVTACSVARRPLRHVSEGPRVPSDLRTPSPAAEARRILPGGGAVGTDPRAALRALEGRA